MIIRSPVPDLAIPDNISLPDFVLQHAKDLPNKAAFIDGPSGRTITFAQLAGAVRMVACGLADRGFGKGDVFAIYSPNLPEYAVAFLAVATLGGIVTTVNPLYTVNELTHQMKDAGAQYILTVPPFLPNALEAAKATGMKEVFVFGEAEGATPFAALMKNSGNLPKVEINPKKDLIVLPYSSGTTGLPKGVMLTHYNLISNILQTVNAKADGIMANGDDTLLGLLPFYHIYGMVVIMFMGGYLGATVVTMPRFDMEQFLTILQKYEVSYAHLVPPIVLGLAKHPLVDKYDLSKLRVIFSGAAPLGGEVENAAAKRLGVLISQGYGMTEASPVTHTRPYLPPPGKPGSIGFALPNTECRIVDPSSGKDVDVKQEGELWIRGPQVMQGYLNNPTATAITVDREGWLHTGDIAYIDEDGHFFIVDRLKELIKYKGLQVAPAELEALLLTHPQIADAAVIGRPDEEAGEVPKAFVVLKGELSEDEIKQFVAERVAPHKRLRFVEIVTQIPKSTSGKILRRMLLAQEKEKMGV